MRLSCLLALAAVLALSAGCQTGEVKAVVPISGGGHITVPLTPAGPPAGEADGYRVERATISPSKELHELRYEFGLVATKPPALRRIQVDDISDETAVPLVDDANPQFTNGHWSAKTVMIPADDPRLRWVFQITRSLRVYRFTLTALDGRQVAFNQVTGFPPNLKSAIRELWGEKY
jgi:hypothetical protein